MGLVFFAGHDCGIGGDGVAVHIGDHAVDRSHVAEFSHGHGVGLAGVAGSLELGVVLILVIPLIGQTLALDFHGDGCLFVDLHLHILGLSQNLQLYGRTGHGGGIGGNGVAVAEFIIADGQNGVDSFAAIAGAVVIGQIDTGADIGLLTVVAILDLETVASFKPGNVCGKIYGCGIGVRIKGEPGAVGQISAQAYCKRKVVVVTHIGKVGAGDGVDDGLGFGRDGHVAFGVGHTVHTTFR